MRRFSGIGAGAGVALTLALVGTCFGAAGESDKYFPKDTEIVVTLNVRQLLGSELVKSNKDAMDKAKSLVQQMLESDQEAQEYAKLLGFDAFRDLDSVTMAMPGSTDQTKSLVIVRGKFDQKKFGEAAEKAAKDHGDIVKITKAGSSQVIEVSPPGENKTFYVSLANPNTILVAQGRDTVTGALGREAGTKAAGLAKEVQTLLSNRDTKQGLSFVATGDALSKIAQSQAQQNPQVGVLVPLLQSWEGLHGFVEVRKDVQFQVAILAKDADSAKQLAQSVSAGIGVAAGMLAGKGKQDPKLAPWVEVVRTIRANSTGNTVVIRGQIPAAAIEQALKNQ